MVTLVTDRTQAHVTRLKTLARKGWNNMTAAERSEWLGETGDTWKGAYNYTDLNRVETAVRELSNLLNLGLTTKNDWALWEIPSSADIKRYINNIVVIRGLYPNFNDIPPAPTTIERFTYVEANNIEQILTDVYEMIETAPTAVLGTMVLGMSTIGEVVVDATLDECKLDTMRLG